MYYVKPILITICEQHFRRNEFIFMSAVVALVVKSPTVVQRDRSVLMESLILPVVLEISTKFASGSKLFGPDEFFEPFIYPPN
jgi:MFS-type transporter involved in bile tolerance (Atg22 family)